MNLFTNFLVDKITIIHVKYYSLSCIYVTRVSPIDVSVIIECVQMCFVFHIGRLKILEKFMKFPALPGFEKVTITHRLYQRVTGISEDSF